MPAEIISVVTDLGGTLSALVFAAYLIIFLLKSFAAEREIHLTKDSTNDAELRSLMRESNAALIATMERNNETLSQLREAISGLHQSINLMERTK